MKKYKAGERIHNIDYLFNFKIVYVTVWKRTQPTAFFQHWTYRELKIWLNAGRFCKAMKVEDEVIYK